MRKLIVSAVVYAGLGIVCIAIVKGSLVGGVWYDALLIIGGILLGGCCGMLGLIKCRMESKKGLADVVEAVRNHGDYKVMVRLVRGGYRNMSYDSDYKQLIKDILGRLAKGGDAEGGEVKLGLGFWVFTLVLAGFAGLGLVFLVLLACDAVKLGQ